MFAKYFWNTSVKLQTYRNLQLSGILSEHFLKDFGNTLNKFLKIGRIDHTLEGQHLIPCNAYVRLVLTEYFLETCSYLPLGFSVSKSFFKWYEISCYMN